MKDLEQLRIFFKISCAAFDFVNSINSAMGKLHTHSIMESLHKMTLSELMKDNPNLNLIDNLLAEMEALSEINKANHEKN